MSLSLVSRGYLIRQRSIVHPLLALVIPFAFLACLDTVMREAFPSLGYPTRLILPILLVVGVEAAAVGNLLRSERVSGYARVRELAAIMALAYLVTAGIASIKAGAMVTGDASFIYPLTLICAQWSFSAVIHSNLRDREILLAYIQDREGESLLHTLRDASLQASAALKGLKRIAVIAIAFQLAIFITLMIMLGVGGEMRAAGVIACGVHAVLGLFALAVINTFAQDQLLLGEGVVVTGRLQYGRLTAGAAMILLCIPVAIMVSRDASPLSLALLARILSWIGALFPGASFQDALRGWRAMLEMQSSYQQQLSQIPVVPIGPEVILFMEILRRVLVTAVVCGVYWFLISPLLSAELMESLSRHRLIAFLAARLRAFLGAFSGAARRLLLLLRSLFLGSRTVEDDSAHPRPPWISAAMKREASARKRFQAGRMVRAFFHLLRWGERRGVEHHAWETLKEYAERFTALVPGSDALMAAASEILEEALFSPRLVEKDRAAVYFSSLREIRQIPASGRHGKNGGPEPAGDANRSGDTNRSGGGGS